MDLDTKDVELKSYQNAVPGADVHLRGTHLPTGLTAVASSKSLHRAKKSVYAQLAAMIYETAGAPCGFCGGDMPCNCPPPNDIDEQIDRDMELRAKYDG